MSTTDRTTLQVELSPESLRRFEEGARALNLTPAGYLEYLLVRSEPDVDPARFDRQVREVFGKHGGLVRRLSQ